MTRLLIIIFSLLYFFTTYGQTTTYDRETSWVDSVYNSMTRHERIGQLFMIRAHSDKNRIYELKVKEQITKYNVGGVCFFQGGPIRQINLVNEYQTASKTPLFVAIDGEWGVGMRLDSSLNFPKQLTLGAVQDDKLLLKIGEGIGNQCLITGINIDFAPVADVNNNPLNPVINIRSFGENPTKVARKATLIMQGIQNQGVMACAKHFPGHGDTESDSHKTLPLVNADLETIEKVNLLPFKELFENKIGSVMNAHLFVPSLDTTKNRASSLSPIIIDSLLTQVLKFNGLKFTDALEMKGVSSFFKPGEIELKALMAGNDILLMPNDLERAFVEIDSALNNGLLDSAIFEQRIKKILRAKYSLKLNTKPVSSSNVYEKINSLKNEALTREAYKKASTLIINDSILPLTTDSRVKIAIVSIGADSLNSFVKSVDKYREHTDFYLPKKPDSTETDTLIKQLETFDLVVVSIMGTNINATSNYGISQATVNFVSEISKRKKVVINISANPYSATRFITNSCPAAVLISYEDNVFTRQISAENIFGGNKIEGKLPVSITKEMVEGFGLELRKSRLSYILPEEIDIDSKNLAKIDSIAQSGIELRAYPGCQVLIAKDGKVFYDKQFGHASYDSTDKITSASIYDIASVTKVAATTISLMKLESENKFDPDRKLSFYLPELKATNKKDMVIRDILTHQARLQAWLPFYKHTLINGKLDSNFYSKSTNEKFNRKVADSIYVISSIEDTIFSLLANSELLQRNSYKYSDLSMILMKKVIEKQSGSKLDKYTDSIFYSPLGMKHTGFNPTNRFDVLRICPTENDTYFRNQLIRGYVHDQTAALLGGVSGHAGLFSTTNDLAILSQMLIQGGSYGEQIILKPQIIDEYTRVQFPLNDNRRGLGFDKPIPLHQAGGPCSQFASEDSYGHSGFTGTLVWIDPATNLIYIFLSNRVYPDAENKKLSSLDIRTNIHDEIFKIINSRN